MSPIFERRKETKFVNFITIILCTFFCIVPSIYTFFITMVIVGCMKRPDPKFCGETPATIYEIFYNPFLWITCIFATILIIGAFKREGFRERAILLCWTASILLIFAVQYFIVAPRNQAFLCKHFTASDLERSRDLYQACKSHVDL